MQSFLPGVRTEIMPGSAQDKRPVLLFEKETVFWYKYNERGAEKERKNADCKSCRRYAGQPGLWL